MEIESDTAKAPTRAILALQFALVSWAFGIPLYFAAAYQVEPNLPLLVHALSTFSLNTAAIVLGLKARRARPQSRDGDARCRLRATLAVVLGGSGYLITLLSLYNFLVNVLISLAG